MKISIENDWLELEPETEDETEALGRFSHALQSAARTGKKIVPQSEYLECAAQRVKLLVSDREQD